MFLFWSSVLLERMLHLYLWPIPHSTSQCILASFGGSDDPFSFPNTTISLCISSSGPPSPTSPTSGLLDSLSHLSHLIPAVGRDTVGSPRLLLSRAVCSKRAQTGLLQVSVRPTLASVHIGGLCSPPPRGLSLPGSCTVMQTSGPRDCCILARELEPSRTKTGEKLSMNLGV